MEFLGAMFQGIGDTFKAGSQVHQAQINARNMVESNKLARETNATALEIEQFKFLNEAASAQFKNNLLIVAAIAAFFGLMVFSKKA